MMTDERLPMTTLGCGEARLDFVPSGQMMASPVNIPRRPSSQVTSLACRVHFCAAAGLAQPNAIIEMRMADAILGAELGVILHTLLSPMVMRSPCGLPCVQISRRHHATSGSPPSAPRPTGGPRAWEKWI